MTGDPADRSPHSADPAPGGPFLESDRSDATLRESLLRNELTFANAPIGQALVELDGSWRQVNDALTRLLEYEREELMGMTFQDITHPDDLDLDLDLLRRLTDGEIPNYQMEKRYYTRTGRVVWVLLSVALVRTETDEPLYFISQILDITARKKQMQALQDLTAMLAHDLRTPATVIYGFAEILSSPTTPSHDVPAIARRILRAATSLTDLLDNSLTAEAIDSGKILASPKVLRVRSSIDDIMASLERADRPEYANDGAAFIKAIDVEHVEDVLVWCDPIHFTHAITNLLTNARKYGGPNIRVSAHTDGKHVVISVEDDGDGVPRDFVPRLFERFSRAPVARASHHRGSGLGLYVVNDLLAANHGTISYTSSALGGAEFRVVLPQP